MKKIKPNVFLDGEWVIKKSPSKEGNKILKQEYQNFLLAKKNRAFEIPEARYDKKNNLLKTKFIDGINLRDIDNPKIFYKFGKKLKEFHDEGYTHSELEIQDVLYKDGKFYIVDLPFLNERPALTDYARVIISLNIRIIRTLKIRRYHLCINKFTKGYNLEDKKLAGEYIKKELDGIIKCYMQSKKLINKLKGEVLYILFKKMRLIKYE